MTRVTASREIWHPQTREDRDAVLLEMQEVLASAHFCNSKRYPALLRYVVEATLAGHSDRLKERTLGVEVFDRSPSYDTNADTVVRYTAGEVRKRLSLYYHELDRKPRIQISLPPGSYVPEFLLAREETDPHRPEPSSDPTTHLGWPEPVVPDTSEHWTPDGSLELHATSVPSPETTARVQAAAVPRSGTTHSSWLAACVSFVVLAIVLGAAWRYRATHTASALDTFWAPVLHGQSFIIVCIGGSVFSQTHLSGVDTATKDIEYPFVSMQSASAIASISSMVDRDGATAQLQSAASTPLTELRDRPLILLGAYNNQWSMRLLAPLPIHFSSTPGVPESIIDSASPSSAGWARDPTKSYSSADDYALVARFRDTATDSWVMTLAGIGRNGTEAAAQFATSPHYVQLLADRIGASALSSENLEVVLRVNVVDGKTGAPSIVATRSW